MRKLIGIIPEESGFIKDYRFHQGWWRTFVLNEEPGMYWDEKNEKCASVCNRINDGEKSLKNFLSDEISNTAKKAIEHNKTTKSGIIDQDRLYNNLLSSQPLAFNFFGFLNPKDEITLRFLKTIQPEITDCESIVLEFAPRTTKDKSAFDFGFIVNSGRGKGFIGFECKYTDTFSYKRKGSKLFYGDKLDKEEDKNYKHYFELYENNRDRFPDNYFTYVRNKHYNQLFRNELLAVQLKSEFAFVVTGLFCHHKDKDTRTAGEVFQKKIGNGKDDFVILTYADYFERMQKLNLTWKQRELVMMLWARYCGLELSKSLLNNC